MKLFTETSEVDPGIWLIRNEREYDPEVYGKVTRESYVVAEAYNADLAERLVRAVNAHEELKSVAEMFIWVCDTQIKKPIEPHPYGLGVMEALQIARRIVGKKVTP